MIKFYKYQGAGNDFIIIDNRNKKNFNIKNAKKIRSICNRHFGIGADGVILLENEMGFDFKMVFANSDGSLGAMCGNGGRCIVHFADRVLKIIKNKNKIKFLAADGTHEAKILKNGLVKLKMQDVKEVQERNGLSFVYSGTTPHNVMYVKDLENFPVFETGKKIRYGDPDGVNVNFVEKKGGILNIRTYERGVEDETLACGTGACSVAVVSHFMGFINKKNCQIKMPGGKLKVEFKTNKDGSYIDVWLTGPAVLAFKGEVV